jgi:hypothetical protein
MQPAEQVTAQVTVQVPPNTVRDDGELALVRALAGQVLDSIRVAPPCGARGLKRISATLEAARQAVARLPVANSIRAAVYHTVQTTVVNATLKEPR